MIGQSIAIINQTNPPSGADSYFSHPVHLCKSVTMKAINRVSQLRHSSVSRHAWHGFGFFPALWMGCIYPSLLSY